MKDTGQEGYCVENVAVIKLKGKKCDHKDYCENLKKQLERQLNENKTTT